MATQAITADIIIRARDAGSAAFSRVAGASGRLGGSFTRLLGILARLNIGLQLLLATLPLIAAGFAAMIGVRMVVNFLNFERASRRARIQLQLLGFSASAARDQVNILTQLMGRSAATSILANAQAMTDVAIAGTVLVAGLAPLVEVWSKLIGADPADVMSAFIDVFAKQDPDKFLRLVAGTEKLAVPMEILANLDEEGLKRLRLFITEIAKQETMTNIEGLAASLERLSEVTAGLQEAIVEGIAAGIDVFVTSLAASLEALKENLDIILVAALAGAFFAAGGGLASSLAGGFALGLAAALLTNMEPVIGAFEEEPLILSAIAIAAGALGHALGGWLLAATLVSVALGLSPGLAKQFKNLEPEKKVDAIAGALGLALGVALGLKFTEAFTLGFLLMTIADQIQNQKTVGGIAAFSAFTLLGGVLGFWLGGGSPMGAILGAYIGTLAFQIWDEHKEDIIDAFKWLGEKIGQILANGIWNEVSAIIAKIRDAVARALQGPPISVPPGGGPGGIVPIVPRRQLGGMVPGLPGQPQMILAHGGETIIPAGRSGGQPMVIQLILDRRIIGEVAVDAFHRTAKFKAGMVSGSIGS